MPTVLTIDDSRTLRVIVRGTLVQRGIDVVEASHGEEGLDLARSRRPDAILLDLIMPVMDGKECLARLREDPVTRGIPVIMLTTEAAQEKVLELMKMGLSGYVVKPFQPDDLMAKLNRAFAAAGSGAGTTEGAPEVDGPAPAARKRRAFSALEDDPGDEPVVDPLLGAFAEPEEEAPEAPPPPPPAGSGGRPLVLAVDDRPDVLDLLEMHLAAEVDFVRASGGLEAVNLIQSRPPDALLLDLDMPGATGADVFLETVEALKGHGSLVWGMSPESRPDDIARAKRAGIRKFLRKPLEEAELAGVADTIRRRSTA